MAAIASYNCMCLPGVNSIEKMKADDNGYYRTILGGFNLNNAHGVYYPLTDVVKALFAPGGKVRKRLDEGICRGEYDHPKLDGMKFEDILYRLTIIEPTMISHHIKSMELVPIKDHKGNDIVAVYGMVRPSGPYGPTLKESMDNREENVTFSVRAFNTVAMVNGKLNKLVNDIITYDHVSEQGIKIANKFDSVTLEKFERDLRFTENDFNKVIDKYESVSMEGSNSLITMVKDSYGWNKIQVVKTSSLNW